MKHSTLAWIVFAAIGTFTLSTELWAQCSINNCEIMNFFEVEDLPDCWASAHCSTDPDFFDPCGSSFVVVNCNGGDGTGTCSTGQGSNNGIGRIQCSRSAWNEQTMSYETVVFVVSRCCGL